MRRDSIILGMSDYRIHSIYEFNPVLIDVRYKDSVYALFVAVYISEVNPSMSED